MKFESEIVFFFLWLTLIFSLYTAGLAPDRMGTRGLYAAGLMYGEDEIPVTFLTDPLLLAKLKHAIETNSTSTSDLRRTFGQLVENADSFLTATPHSVIEKREVPPSGDKHDFLALSPYAWPDPLKKTGLPYIFHDGVINPEINSVPDKQNLDEMIFRVKTLATAYYFTGNTKYASKTRELLQSWFLNNGTDMNPNLKYGELVRGGNNVSSFAVMAGRNLTDVIEAVGLIKNSPVWTRADQEGINSWFTKYLDWLLNSEAGKMEVIKINNHGTYYDVQVSSIALFLNKTQIARNIINELIGHKLQLKIESDGRQPYELRRTKALDYSIFNLLGLFKMAVLAEHLKIDLWNIKTEHGRTLQKALDFIMPYILHKRAWPYPQIVPIRINVLNEMLCQAMLHYQNSSYVQAYQSIEGSKVVIDIDDIACRL